MGCRPSLPGEENDSSTPDLGTQEGCGDGEALPGEFCFSQIAIINDAEFGLRRASVAAPLTPGTAELLIFRSGNPDRLEISLISLITADMGTAAVDATLDGLSAQRLFLSDLDGDGDKDLLATVDATFFDVSWREGDSFVDVEIVDLGLPGSGHVLPIDVDGDGIPELLKANQFYGEIGGTAELFRRAGDSWQSSGQVIEVPGCGGLRGPGATLALARDLNGDGAQDLVLGGDPVYSGEQIACEQAPQLHDVLVLLANPETGLLGEPTVVLHDQPLLAVYVGDVDGDGHLDVASAPYAGGSISIAKGKSGVFAEPEVFDIPTTANGSHFDAPILGDFDGDGAEEFVIVSGEGIAIYTPGNASPSLLDLGYQVSHPENLGDLNADGIDDLIFSDSTSPGADPDFVLLSNP